MDLTRKILVVHAEARARRRLVLLLVEAGYDVRAFSVSEPALAAARSEWFDLALVDFALPGGEGFGFAGLLREAQPTLPVIMLLPELELPLIIQGIRLGLTDVLASEEDPRPVLRRINALLRPTAAAAAELSAEELAEVDEVLARLDGDAGPEPADAPAGAPAELREQLRQAMQERAVLESRLEREARERALVEAQLQTLLSQQADAARLQAELAALEAQRESATAAQAAIDAKTRELADSRAAIAVERQALEEVKREIVNSRTPFAGRDAALEAERAHLEAFREDLHEEEVRLREEAARLRQEATQLALERRRWHVELDQLREQEENLRAYEQRLREQQAQLEADRVNLRAGPPARSPVDAFVERDVKLRSEWEKLYRANELLEAERRVFRDERMALQDLEQTIRAREERLRQLEVQVAAHETLRRHLPPPPPAAASPHAAEAGKPGGVLKALTRAPFARWGKGDS